MNETKRVFKWFWAWNDEREEAWLTEMGRQRLLGDRWSHGRPGRQSEPSRTGAMARLPKAARRFAVG